MSDLLTPQNIMFALGIIGMMFSIYIYFRAPQIDGDKRDALLDQSVKYQNESVDRRFTEIQNNFKELLLQSNNHIHTVDTKVEVLTTEMGKMSNEITKLATIIDERIPKK